MSARPRFAAAIDGPAPTRRRAERRGALPGVPPDVADAVRATHDALDALLADAAPAPTVRRLLAVSDVSAIAPEHFGAPIPTVDECIDGYGWRWTARTPLSLGVTHLDRAVGDAVTKGDLLRYYVRVAPYLLRALAGRPLVLRRFTDSVASIGERSAFYQQHVNGPAPDGVLTAQVPGDKRARFIGGNLVTLLYLVQLGAISTDPWHGRADAPDLVDYTIVDLDPGPAAPFTRVVDVARWVRDELETLGLTSLPKTSGASGMHIVVPLPSDTRADAARLLAELVATQVAARNRRAATVVRTVRERPTGAVYVDYLQNIPGKTVASAYAARATPTLTVSTPLDWSEVTPKLDPRDFTVHSVPPRLAEVGDLWAESMRRGNDLEALRRVLHAPVRRNA